MAWRVRRVVTGHNAQGRSVFLDDGLAPNIKEMESMPGLALTDLWETDDAPASNEGNADAAAGRCSSSRPRPAPFCASSSFRRTPHWRGQRRRRRGLQLDRRRPRAGPHSSDDPMMPQDQHGRLHHRAQGRDLRDHGRGREAPESRRHSHPARHQPLLERARQRAVHRRGRAGRRQSGVTARTLRALRPPSLRSRRRS